MTYEIMLFRKVNTIKYEFFTLKIQKLDINQIKEI